MALVYDWGRWPSPLSPSDAADASTRVADPGFLDGRLAWVTTLPSAGGHPVLVAAARSGPPVTVSPPGCAVRSRLYLNGAGSWCATPLGAVVVDGETQSLRLAGTEGPPVGDAPADRVGDPTSVHETSWVLVVSEPAHADGPRRLCAVDVGSGRRVELLSTEGFLGDLACSQDGRRVAFVHWPHGSMPWDAAELWVADLAVSDAHVELRGAHRAEGGRGASCGQPTFLEDGALAYVSEAAGIWQPWVLDRGGVARRACARRAEFQRPRWLTCRWLAAVGDGTLSCAFSEGGTERVGVLTLDGSLEVIDQPCVRIDGLAASGGRIAWVGATTQAQGVVMTTTATSPATTVSTGPAPPVAASEPARFGFDVGGVSLEGWYWAPKLDGATGPASAPPLVVSVHPGPTGAADASYAPGVHLLTSRGYAVASIDYSGSTGAGRALRDRLLGRFCVADVAECATAARHLCEAGLADPEALFVRGTSAGGTTALLALAADTFRGAVAWYPASEFDDEEEGFEAGYLALLTGPEGSSRGPLARASSLRGAALLVQGAEDPLVSPSATRRLAAALREHLDEVELLEVPGEGHGFRTATGRASALRAELDFYERTLRRSRDPARYDSTTASST